MSATAGSEPNEPDARLVAHLRSWLGAWPPRERLEVFGADARSVPGWDGRVRRLIGVSTPTATLLSVSPDRVDAVRALGGDPEADGYGPALAAALDRPEHTFGTGVFRWSANPVPLEEVGTWLPRSDGRVPAWLRPFNGEVLVALEGEQVIAGVGRKQHDRQGHELAVVTDEAARGRGLARRLVATAARRVLADGAVPTYLHGPENAASAHVADAAGFPDCGWHVHGLFGPDGEG